LQGQQASCHPPRSRIRYLRACIGKCNHEYLVTFADPKQALARAVPDPNVAYRKSQRSQQAADEIARQKPTPPATSSGPAIPSLTADSASPIPKRQRRQSPRPGTAAAQDDMAIDDDRRHLTLEATTTLTTQPGAQVDMEAEIQSAKQLVMDLKRELRLRAAAGEELEDQGHEVGEESRGVKRVKGTDEAVVISGGAGKERVVKRSKRVDQNSMGETAKRVAWGALIFGLGVGAAS